jgi:hypothetical protein
MKQLAWIETLFSRIEKSINDPHNHVYEYFYQIRNKIDLRVEHHLIECKNQNDKAKIRDVQDKMIEKLATLEAELMDKVKGSILNDENFAKNKREEIDYLRENLKEFTTIPSSDSIKTLAEWTEYKEIKTKLNFLQSQVEKFYIKLRFYLLSGHYIVFEDQLNEEQNYMISFDKLKVYCVYDYKLEKGEDKITENQAEDIYLYEVNIYLVF